MTEDYILGNLDLASISLWLFFIFFVGLVIWIQRENQREGYPLLDEDGSQADAGSVFPNPADKTFKLPHGRGEYTVPSGQTPERTDIDEKLTRQFDSGGFPFDPVAIRWPMALVQAAGRHAAMSPSSMVTVIQRSFQCPAAKAFVLPPVVTRAACRLLQATEQLSA